MAKKRDLIKDIIEKTTEEIPKGKDMLEKETKELEDFIKKEPLKSVAAAFVFGLLIGKVMK